MISTLNILFLVLFFLSTNSGDEIQEVIKDLRKLCGAAVCKVNSDILAKMITPNCCGTLKMKCCYDLTTLSYIIISIAVVIIVSSIIGCCAGCGNRKCC